MHVSADLCLIVTATTQGGGDAAGTHLVLFYSSVLSAMKGFENKNNDARFARRVGGHILESAS